MWKYLQFCLATNVYVYLKNIQSYSKIIFPKAYLRTPISPWMKPCYWQKSWSPLGSKLESHTHRTCNQGDAKCIWYFYNSTDMLFIRSYFYLKDIGLGALIFFFWSLKLQICSLIFSIWFGGIYIFCIDQWKDIFVFIQLFDLWLGLSVFFVNFNKVMHAV